MHSEYSYANEWPMKLIFGCIQPAKKGGATPLASTRGVLNRLSKDTQRIFSTRKLMYVRNYRKGLGVAWQSAFQTNIRSEVDSYCARAGIQTKWLSESDLQTVQYGPAIVRHPQTGDEVWFNHGFFFNINALEPLELRTFFLDAGPDMYSTNSYFGDGSEIPMDLLEEIRTAFGKEKVSFEWHRGDILIVDNMLVAHGREPFEGDREIVVVMTDRLERSGISS
jgi:alpha-ketoglutarate-dependent taurine dioxygenase